MSIVVTDSNGGVYECATAEAAARICHELHAADERARLAAEVQPPASSPVSSPSTAGTTQGPEGTEQAATSVTREAPAPAPAVKMSPGDAASPPAKASPGTTDQYPAGRSDFSPPQTTEAPAQAGVGRPADGGAAVAAPQAEGLRCTRECKCQCNLESCACRWRWPQNTASVPPEEVPTAEEGRQAVERLGINVPAWATEIRAKVAAATAAPEGQPANHLVSNIGERICDCGEGEQDHHGSPPACPSDQGTFSHARRERPSDIVLRVDGHLSGWGVNCAWHGCGFRTAEFTKRWAAREATVAHVKEAHLHRPTEGQQGECNCMAPSDEPHDLDCPKRPARTIPPVKRNPPAAPAKASVCKAQAWCGTEDVPAPPFRQQSVWWNALPDKRGFCSKDCRDDVAPPAAPAKASEAGKVPTNLTGNKASPLSVQLAAYAKYEAHEKNREELHAFAHAFAALEEQLRAKLADAERACSYANDMAGMAIQDMKKARSRVAVMRAAAAQVARHFEHSHYEAPGNSYCMKCWLLEAAAQAIERLPLSTGEAQSDAIKAAVADFKHRAAAALRGAEDSAHAIELIEAMS